MKTFSTFLLESLLFEAKGSIAFIDSKLGKIEIIGTKHSDIRLDRPDQEISIEDQESIKLIEKCLDSIFADLMSNKIKNNIDGLKEAALIDRSNDKNLNVIIGLYINEPQEPNKKKIRIGTTMTKRKFEVKGSHTRVYLIDQSNKVTSMDQETWNNMLRNSTNRQA